MPCYRIEAGTGSNVVVGQVDTDDAGLIVATPPIWHKFKGQQLHRLTWWLAAKYRSCRPSRMPDLANPDKERERWENALKAANSESTVSEERG